jgi:hypothetical protein
MPELLREANGLTVEQLRFLREQTRKLKERGTPGGGSMKGSVPFLREEVIEGEAEMVLAVPLRPLKW